jgi:hypothetical protein
VILDVWDNSAIGSSVARSLSEIQISDFIAVIGAPLYKEKYENKSPTKGHKVAAEVDLINIRLTSTEEKKKTVLPILLEGEEEESFPPFLQGRVYGDFREEHTYFTALFDLVLTIFQIPFDHPTVKELRELLQE